MWLAGLCRPAPSPIALIDSPNGHATVRNTMALTKNDLASIRTAIREETKHFATKHDLSGVEGRLTAKIGEEAERIAQITVRRVPPYS